MTKTALPNNQQKINLIFGSHNLHRVEIDINRRVNDKLSLRAVMAYQDVKGFQRHAGREIKAAFLTASYRPLENTKVNLSGELGRNHINLGANAMADQFSTTTRTGQTAAISDTTGGYTFLPGRGLFYRTTSALQRSSGTGLAVFDESIQPRELNFNGPDGQNRVHYGALNMQISQKVTNDFNVQIVGAYQKAQRTARQRAGSSVDRIYIDTDRTLPNGTINPYFNEYYTEFYNRNIVHTEPQHNVRATAVYDLDLKFTKQRIIGVFLHHDSDPQNEFYTETVDPKGPNFTGSLANAENSLAAYQANRTVHSRNFFYRRYYLKDGDGKEITKKTTVPGQSVMMRDAVADGGNGRLADEFYRTPGYGFGASGSYLNGRLHTLAGWRRSAFNVSRGRDFYNYVTGLTYRVSTIPGLAQPNVIRITKDRVNYGGVLHLADFVAAYFNYAQSMALSSGVGGAQLRPNTLRGPGLGDGNEYGLRWSFLGGRIESNWTYYMTNQLRVGANPGIPTAVGQNELARIFTDINPTGGDTQATKASGVEFETVANLTKNWRLIWNYATNKLATSDRYPDLRYYQARAKAQNTPTPETDAFLATVPDGTPLPGFTKIRSNLVTNYRFSEGRLKGFSIGGGGQYRDMAYRGNFDLNRDGIAEQLWSPGYTILNLYIGYRTKILNRSTDINVNINNLLDKSYYRSLGIGAGAWEDGRNFRVAVRTEL